MNGLYSVKALVSRPSWLVDLPPFTLPLLHPTSFFLGSFYLYRMVLLLLAVNLTGSGSNLELWYSLVGSFLYFAAILDGTVPSRLFPVEEVTIAAVCLTLFDVEVSELLLRGCYPGLWLFCLLVLVSAPCYSCPRTTS